MDLPDRVVLRELPVLRVTLETQDHQEMQVLVVQAELLVLVVQAAQEATAAAVLTSVQTCQPQVLMVAAPAELAAI